MAENFRNLGKEIDNQGQEVPKQMNSKGHTPKRIIIKLWKVNFKISLFHTREPPQTTEKQLVSHKGSSIDYK